jgi:hypothetical protein
MAQSPLRRHALLRVSRGAALRVAAPLAARRAVPLPPPLRARTQGRATPQAVLMRCAAPCLVFA